MHIKEIITIIVAVSGMNIGMVTAMWWQLDSKIESRIGRVESRIGRVETLLTENLIVLNRDLGELKGAAHTHTQP